jgi:hypothetical protein
MMELWQAADQGGVSAIGLILPLIFQINEIHWIAPINRETFCTT